MEILVLIMNEFDSTENIQISNNKNMNDIKKYFKN